MEATEVEVASAGREVALQQRHSHQRLQQRQAGRRRRQEEEQQDLEEQQQRGQGW